MAEQLEAVLAGFGGQGVLFAGKVVAYAGLIEGREVSWLPSYGPEMRGGTANCSVTLADDPIGGPLVIHPNALVAMNQPSFDKFLPEMAPDGVVVYDSILITPGEDLKSGCGIPASKIAEEAGLDGLMNIVLVGALWAKMGFCKRETLDEAIDRCVPASKAALIEKNKLALKLGIEAAQ